MNRLLVFLTVNFVLTSALPDRAQDLSSTLAVPDLFSYQMPRSWKSRDVSFSKYPVAFGQPTHGFSPNINVVMEHASVSLDEYIATSEKVLKATPVFSKLEIVDESPFQTTSGVSGKRVLIRDTMGTMEMQQVFYFFTGSSDEKFVVTASCAAGDSGQFAPIFDASLKTFSSK